MSETDLRAVIVLLNSLQLSEVARVRRDLERARGALQAAGLAELGEKVGMAEARLAAGDVREFRRCLAQVTARLGHLQP